MKPPIVCFVGKSKVGKTTFLEKLIPELVSRGIRLGVIKHDVHGFEMDQPGKDTWRLRQAGAGRVVISSPLRFALIGLVEEELSLDEIVGRYLSDVDIVLAEGYKRSVKPKVEVARAERSCELLCAPEELVAVVSDFEVSPPCPHFGLDDAAGVANLLEERFLNTSPRELSLRVDGRDIPLKPFIHDMLIGAVRGLLSGLKEANGEQVELYIRSRR
jgi:molybdopterin-guanine dinucleotide biosynthesis protein B